MKKIIGLLLALTLVITISGCTKKDAYADLVVLDELPTEQIEINFWHAMGDENMLVLDELIKEFNKTYPNITVTHTAQGGYTDVRDNTLKAITAGTEPTMLIGYPDHIAKYLTASAVLPLDAFMNHKTWGYTEEEINDFIPSYLNEGKIYDSKGTYYAIPFNKSTEVMFYNADVVKNVPNTWEEVEAIDKGEAEFVMGYDSSSNLFITMAEQWGAAYTGINEETGKGEYLFNNADAIAGLTYFQGLYDNKILATPTEWDENYGSALFANGTILLTVGSSAGAKYNMTKDFTVGVAQIPQKDATNPRVIQQGTNISIMSNATNEERLAAWLFTKFLTDTEANTQFAIGSGYLPVRESAFQSADYQKYLAKAELAIDENVSDAQAKEIMMARAAKVGYDQKAAYFTSPAFNGSSKARDEVGNIIDQMFYQNKGIQEAIDAAIEELNW